MTNPTTPTGLNKEIIKMWNMLKKQPEKGHVLTKSKKYDKELSTYIYTYEPDKDTFLAANQTQWQIDKETHGSETGDTLSWVTWIKDRKIFYGIGSKISKFVKSRRTGVARRPESWWEKNKVHLSKDEQYYIVPIVYENVLTNPYLSNFKDSKGNLKILDGLLKDDAFKNSAKIVALQKLAQHLNKTITEDIKEEALKIAFFPSNEKIQENSAANYDKEKKETSPKILAENFHVNLRGSREFQNLWLKVQFDKGWVDALSDNQDSGVDYNLTTREVIVFAKDIRRFLENLEKILFLFHGEIVMSNIYIEFDASCTAGLVSKIYEQLNTILFFNDKLSIKELEKTSGAFQFGFSDKYELQYVAYSEKADCLCEENADLSAYVLKTGIEQVKSMPPFSNPTINALIHYLPDINRRYGRFLSNSTGLPGNDAFSTNESFLEFVKSYIYPPKEVFFKAPSKGLNASLTHDLMGIAEIAKNPLVADLLFKGTYVKDPTKILDPAIRDQIIATSNATNMHAGDNAMMKALMGEISSMTSLYDKLLNNIPLSELTKFAFSIIVKCLPREGLRREVCKMMLNSLPLIAIRNQLYPCLRERGDQGELAIALLEEKISGRVGAVYAAAQTRFGEDEFPDSARSEVALTKISKFYCSDPRMQKKLGRAPDDFSPEFAAWAEEVATDVLCDCVLTLYSPITELLNFSQTIYDDTVEGLITSERNRPKRIEQEGTLSLDKFIDPFTNYTENRIENFGDTLGMARSFLEDSSTTCVIRAKEAKDLQAYKLG